MCRVQLDAMDREKKLIAQNLEREETALNSASLIVTAFAQIIVERGGLPPILPPLDGANEFTSKATREVFLGGSPDSAFDSAALSAVVPKDHSPKASAQRAVSVVNLPSIAAGQGADVDRGLGLGEALLACTDRKAAARTPVARHRRDHQGPAQADVALGVPTLDLPRPASPLTASLPATLPALQSNRPSSS